MLKYQALFDPDPKGGFVVTFPDFDWGVTQGDSEEEAHEMAADALSMVITHYIHEGIALPVPRKHRGRHYRAVRLPALVAAKAALYSAFLQSGIRKSELARRLNIPRMNVDRLFDPKHNSRLEQIEAALRVIGKELDITIRDAA
ncbi:MAG: type II toxin-antitoxin system HicB family antitoxin [Acidobacteriota bacterium]